MMMIKVPIPRDPSIMPLARALQNDDTEPKAIL